MRRTILTTLMGAGAAISLLTGSSLFAASTDRAETGANKFETKGRAKKMDVQLATWNWSAATCEGWTDHLSTGVLNVTDAEPVYYPLDGAAFCLRNNSPTAAATVAISALDLLDVDVACTGDEAVVDTSCGGDQAGELLAARPRVSFEIFTGCDTNPYGSQSDNLSAYATPRTFVTLAAGERACVRPYISYNVSDDAAEKAQSDRVTWRFAFDAAIAPPA